LQYSTNATIKTIKAINMRIEQTDIATATLLLITQGVGSVKFATLVMFL
jgi:hypothetical protein